MRRNANNEMMSEINSIIAIFDSQDTGKNAIRKLQRYGFDLKRMSIIGKDYLTESYLGCHYNAVVGPLVSHFVGALEAVEVVGGLSALGAGLLSIGIPMNSIVRYEAELKDDKFLMILQGTIDEVEQARELLNQSQASTIKIHTEQLSEWRSVSTPIEQHQS